MRLTWWDAMFLGAYALVVALCLGVVAIFKDPNRPMVTRQDVLVFVLMAVAGLLVLWRERSRSKRRRVIRSSSSGPS